MCACVCGGRRDGKLCVAEGVFVSDSVLHVGGCMCTCNMPPSRCHLVAFL